MVAIRPGRSERSRQQIESHAGRIAGSDAAFEALFRAHGVARAVTVDEWWATIALLAVRGGPPRAAGSGRSWTRAVRGPCSRRRRRSRRAVRRRVRRDARPAGRAPAPPGAPARTRSTCGTARPISPSTPRGACAPSWPTRHRAGDRVHRPRRLRPGRLPGQLRVRLSDGRRRDGQARRRRDVHEPAVPPGRDARAGRGRHPGARRDAQCGRRGRPRVRGPRLPGAARRRRADPRPSMRPSCGAARRCRAARRGGEPRPARPSRRPGVRRTGG